MKRFIIGVFYSLIVFCLMMLYKVVLMSDDNVNIKLNISLAVPTGGDNHDFEITPFSWVKGGGACTGVSQSSFLYHHGINSLIMNFNLTCASNEGVVQWTLNGTNLYNKEISAWFYCPSGSGGPGSAPNGLIIFAQAGESWDWYQRDWVNLDSKEGNWFQLLWPLTNDWATNIMRVGIKYAAAGSCSSANHYNGSIYMDEFYWTNSPTPPLPKDNNGFEGLAYDWVAETYATMKAVRDIKITNNIVHGGLNSLQLNCDLDCSSSNSVGAIKFVFPSSEDLYDKDFSANIYLPSGSGGPWNHANGVTLYVKTGPSWTFRECMWKEIDTLASGTWYNLSFSLVSNWATDVREIGIKYAASGTCDADNHYNGPIYIDDISWNKGGAYKWTRSMGSTGVDEPHGITTDNNDNIFIIGKFQNTVNFGVDWGETDEKSSPNGNDDIFITKINTDNTYAWTKQIGGSADDRGKDIICDNSGNCYLTGYFSGSNVNFAEDWSGTDNKTNMGSSWDVFITKINSAGTYAWTKRMGGLKSDTGNGIAVDNSDNIYIVGDFRTNVNFAKDWNQIDNKTNAGNGSTTDIFITKINSDDSYGWTKCIRGTNVNDDLGNDIAIDNNGNIYITGAFSGTINFAQDWGGSDTKTALGNHDIYVTKINSDGSYGWTKRIGGSDNSDGGTGIEIDNNNNIYITGYFENTVNFADDWSQIDEKNASSFPNINIFVTRINANGSYGWTKCIDAMIYDNKITIDNNNNIYVTGVFYFYSQTIPLNFAEDWNMIDNKKNRFGTGEYEICILKINADGSYGWVKIIGDDYHDGGRDITTDSNGYVYCTGYYYLSAGSSINFGYDWGIYDNKTVSVDRDRDVFILKLTP